MKYPKIILLILIVANWLQIIGQVEYPYFVPPKNPIVRINIQDLQSEKYIDDRSDLIKTAEDYFSSLTAEDFISKANAERDCQSVLRKGIKCYEIKNAKIGYNEPLYLQNYQYQSSGYFRSFSPHSAKLQIFYDVEKNKFYINSSDELKKLLGPFLGEPLAALENAKFPAKKRTEFADVKFSYLSKRWEFPDEKDALVNRENDSYDFVGGRMSGRQIENMRLQSQFFRFRVENNSEELRFLLYAGINPEIFYLEKFPEWINWARQTPARFNSDENLPLGSLNWVAFPKHSAIEFEIPASCDIREICAVGIYLNDEQSFWNEVQTLAVYPGSKQRVFSPEYAPPKRK